MNLIEIRRRELTDENSRLAATIASNEAELAELATTEKVLMRLTGASGVSVVTPDAKSPTRTFKKLPQHRATKTAKRTPGKRPLAEVIMEIVHEKVASGIHRMEPKEAMELTIERWKDDAKPQDVSTAFWRLMKQGQLVKDEGTSFYRLPQKKEPADNMPSQASTGSLFETPAQGREAGPGGGT